VAEFLKSRPAADGVEACFSGVADPS
ncbi:MAG: hypothetical protein QOE80_3730, partial [Actinomycetota bacterium]|nr:hypothetical protein [Actinomycetota bacterium]